MGPLGDNIKASLRGLFRDGATSSLLIMTLATGIGATATIWSFAQGLLFSPLPFRDSDRLVHIATWKGGQAGKVSTLEVQDIRERSRLIEDVAAHRGTQWAAGEGQPEAIPGTIATWNLFDLLGVKPLLGSTWPKEHDRSRVFAVVLSHGLWERRFGSDPHIVNRTIQLDGAPYQVLGVMPPGFAYPAASDLWRRSPDPDYDNRSIRASTAVGRLRPGVSVAQAQAEIDTIATRLQAEFPETNRGIEFRVSPLRNLWVGDAALYVALLGFAVSFVLIIACANAASLLFARHLQRRRETAIRVALGASPKDLVMLHLAEGLSLAAPALLGGLGVAAFLHAVFEKFLTRELPPWIDPVIGTETLMVAVLVSIGTVLIAQVAPVRHMIRVEPQNFLRDASARTSGTGSARTGRGLVAAQLGLCLLLLAGAGLMLKALLRLNATDLGFDPDNTLTVKVDPPWTRFGRVEETAPFYLRIHEEILRIPGVIASASNDALPLTSREAQEGQAQMTVEAEGRSTDENLGNPYVRAQIVSHGYFETMRVTPVAGRVFASHDRNDTERVTVIAHSLARRLWPGRDPLGQRLRLGQRNANYRPGGVGIEPPWLTVIGTVAAVRPDALEPPGFDVYMSDQQMFAPETHLIVRASVDPANLAHDVRAAVLRADPEQPIFDVKTLGARLADRIWQHRLSGSILAVLSGTAMLLASIGLFGLVSRGVRARRNEIAVRICLGASPWGIARLVLGELGPTLLVSGLGGVLGAALLFPLLGPFIPEPASDDWVVLPAAFAFLSVVALFAVMIPALQAARQEPVTALRGDR